MDYLFTLWENKDDWVGFKLAFGIPCKSPYLVCQVIRICLPASFIRVHLRICRNKSQGTMRENREDKRGGKDDS